MKATVIDLFCGAGGLTHGFVKEKFKVVAGIDIDETCRYPYEKNNDAMFLHKSIEDVTSEEINDIFGNSSIKILVGCAPCQPFSSYSKKRSKDEKWKLLYAFSKLIAQAKPDIVSMENVPQLKTHKIFDHFVEKLENEGYAVSWYMVYCPDYGIPQTRKRLVLFASKFGRIELIKKTHKPGEYKTVRDSITKLEPIEDGEMSQRDPLHRSSPLSELNKKRIIATPQGGGWKDWDKNLMLKCHKKRTGKSFKNVYGRMIWDMPAPTITTQCIGLGHGRFGHPEQHRAISLREAAMLQTFPKGYKFLDPESKFYVNKTARHIGNAVPVKLGQVIARSIKNHVRLIHGTERV